MKDIYRNIWKNDFILNFDGTVWKLHKGDWLKIVYK